MHEKILAAAKLFVGVQADDQQAVDFTIFKGLAPFEFAIDPAPLWRSTKLTHLCSDKLTHPVSCGVVFSFQGVAGG
jgi:hypothetical protein